MLSLNAAAFAFLETALVPALPLVQVQLGGAGATSSALLESAYLAVAAVASLLLGRWGDKAGKKGPLLVALAIYLVGAVDAGFATSVWVLIPFRALQGAGGAVLALSFSIVRDRAPEGRTGMGIGFLVGAFGAGVAVGFGLSNVIATALDWRWIFWLGAVGVFAGALLVLLFVPRSEPHPETKVDVWGAVLLGLAISCLVIATAFGQPAGWNRWFIIELFLLAIGLSVAWIFYERSREQPLLNVRALASARILLPNLGALFTGYAMFSLFLSVPRHVHAPRGLPPEIAATLGYGLGVPFALVGLFLLPAGLGILVGGPLGGYIGRRWTGKWPFVAGLALLGLGSFFMVIFDDTAVEVLAWMFVAGLGFGGSIGASADFVAESAPRSSVGVATAFNSVMRLVGGSVGAEVASAIFSAHLVAGQGGPASAASKGGIQAIFWIAAAVAFAAAGLALFVPIGKRG